MFSERIHYMTNNIVLKEEGFTLWIYWEPAQKQYCERDSGEEG